MSYSTQNHNFVLNQIQECMKACGEVLEEATENKMQTTAEDMKKVYSQLIDLQQDFEIYSSVLEGNPIEMPFESIMQEIEHIKQLRFIDLKRQKEQMMSSILNNNDGDDEDVELDDTDTSAGLICPITSALPEHPVISKICHHVYDKRAITRYIQQQNSDGKRDVICPAIGCNQTI